MKAENFCFWLQGFFELGNDQGDGLTAKQAEQVRTHLALVFKHDPAMAHPSPKKVPQSDLQKALDDALKRDVQNVPAGRRFRRDLTLYC